MKKRNKNEKKRQWTACFNQTYVLEGGTWLEEVDVTGAGSPRGTSWNVEVFDLPRSKKPKKDAYLRLLLACISSGQKKKPPTQCVINCDIWEPSSRDRACVDGIPTRWDGLSEQMLGYPLVETVWVRKCWDGLSEEMVPFLSQFSSPVGGRGVTAAFPSHHALIHSKNLGNYD